jgi:hypothetical protein
MSENPTSALTSKVKLTEKETSRFLSDIQKNKYNQQIIKRLPSLKLNDTWLVAGCLFQTIWNLKSNKQPEDGINDYDIFYYDPDTSYDTEDKNINRVGAIFSDLPIRIELRNQARVPVWYKEKFGFDYPAVKSSKDNISRFFFCCNCVGLTVNNGQINIYAPFGIDDIYSGILRPNHTVDAYITEESRKKKAENYLSRWPWLELIYS